MADDLDDGEFWLPPQFLTDDDILMDYSNSNTINFNKRDAFGRERDNGFCFPYEFPYGFGSFAPYSDLSSPVESVVGSTETESDEEDYITGLTRKLARATLQDDLWKGDTGFAYQNQKSTAMSGSPQSTLCAVLGGCGCKQGSSSGSPNCPSQMSSPPATAAMSRNEDRLGSANRGVLVPPRKPSPVSIRTRNLNPTPNVGFNSNQSLAYQQLQVTHFQQLKRQQMMKQQYLSICGQSKAVGQYQQNNTHQMIQNRAKSSGACSLDHSVSAWPTLQQSQQQLQPGSGMRAVFLRNPRPKRECAGTGVFLPRRIGNSIETRTKPACSTVLLPDRVVQALNLNLDAMDGHPHLPARYNDRFSPDYDAAMKYRSNVLDAQQRRNHPPQPVVEPSGSASSGGDLLTQLCLFLP
ncbi:hypothetical protein F0562_016646 [Nyssa sinensis]|uniref:Uncharacterized protein n=1 Tax=Nyssa sinensis TaxID=561372 RepID=A0A5J4ZCF5_9ASTE|nr:hypothetical protein F0562_016646 [Nyssa sinensis]